MIAWIFNIAGLMVSWHYTNLGSASILHSTVFPIFVALFSIALLIKFVFLLGPSSGRGMHGGNGGGDGGGFLGGSGGDGGCGSDGGGD